ncbi:MAG: tetratricopeptide repeat protein, partial [Arenimonas sp.]|nr:tetratricopeptide repeat protein [Arenimonas sp.]
MPLDNSQQDSKELNLRLNATWQLFQKGDVVKATQLAEQMAIKHPRSIEAQQLLGICYAQQGNDAAAEVTFQNAIRLVPNHPQLLANLATLWRRQNRLEEAVQLWRRAVSTAPNFVQAWIDLGLAELQIGHVKQAVASLQKATILQPQSALAWHGLGNAQRALNELAESEQAFKNAVQLDAQYGSAWLNLGIVLRLLGRTDESLLSLERARQCGFDGPALCDARAGSLLDNGQIDLAFQQAQQLVNSFPDYVPGHNTYANMLWEYGEKWLPEQDPLNAFRAAVLMQPHNRALQISYTAFLIKAQQGSVALEHIEAFIEHNDLPDAMILQANALELLGETTKASKLFERIYQILGSNDISFMNAYTRHLIKAGRWDAASKCAMETIQADAFNQEAWAYLGIIWRLQGDSREFWLCDYERFITLQEIELPSGYSELPEFLATLRETLDHLHTANRAPIQQSLRDGSQTPGVLFGRKNPVIASTQRALQQAIEAWMRQLPADPSHPFLGRNAPSVNFSGSWSVKLWSSGRHVNHIHPEGWMSSAFYVALPSSVISTVSDNTAGYIQFGQPLAELNLDLPPRRTLKPELGKLALFPSYMWHGTVPFMDEEPRIT